MRLCQKSNIIMGHDMCKEEVKMFSQQSDLTEKDMTMFGDKPDIDVVNVDGCARLVSVREALVFHLIGLVLGFFSARAISGISAGYITLRRTLLGEGDFCAHPRRPCVRAAIHHSRRFETYLFTASRTLFQSSSRLPTLLFENKCPLRSVPQEHTPPQDPSRNSPTFSMIITPFLPLHLIHRRRLPCITSSLIRALGRLSSMPQMPSPQLRRRRRL